MHKSVPFFAEYKSRIFVNFLCTSSKENDSFVMLNVGVSLWIIEDNHI